MSTFPSLRDAVDQLPGKGSRIGFYSAETSADIPAKPGCYAWLVPMWIYDDNIETCADVIGSMLTYGQNATRNVVAKFSWENIYLNVAKKREITFSDRKKQVWAKLLQNSKTRSALQLTLLEASLLMPPLYVGKTKDLRARYVQHTSDVHTDQNEFRRRFDEFVATRDIPISVSDLLFVCIQVAPDVRNDLESINIKEREFDELVENFLMQLSMPPFSER